MSYSDCINPRRPRRGVVFPCRKCLHCRERSARELAGRQILEFSRFGNACFATCTYADESLPAGGNLSREDYRSLVHFLSRARPYGLGLRYVGVGHYGGRTHRPHYHFNLGSSDSSLTVFDIEAALSARWSKGFVQVLPFAPETAAYVARHQTGKWAGFNDPVTAALVAPFATWSRRPALAWDSWRDSFASWFGTDEGQRFLCRSADVPSVIRQSGKFYPVGATVRRKAREFLDLPSSDPRRGALAESVQLAKESDPEYMDRVRNSYDLRKARALARHRSGKL